MTGDAPVPCAVVGAGAAGLIAAIFAGRGGAAPLLLETREKPGAKIRVSGGGRCNLLPSRAELDDFHTQGSRNALRNLFASWPLDQVRAFFEDELGIALKVEETGKVFPVSDDPRQVLDALLGEAARAGARLVSPCRVEELVRLGDATAPLFELVSKDGTRLRAQRVVLATGGLSLPKTGSDGGGLRLAERLGHSLVPTYPALVPLLATEPDFGALAGISLRAALRAVRGDTVLEEREGDLLFTHKGFSGPVVLDLSHHVARPGGEDVRLVARWIGRSRPAWDEHLRRGGKRAVGGLVRDELPRRLADLLLARAGVDAEQRASELSREARKRLVGELDACVLPVAGNEGYRTAEVTGGGVSLAEVVTRTLESRIVPGMYFAGEILDVTGRIGGFNFLWAWVSGRVAGSAVAKAARESARSEL